MTRVIRVIGRAVTGAAGIGAAGIGRTVVGVAVVGITVGSLAFGAPVRARADVPPDSKVPPHASADRSFRPPLEGSSCGPTSTTCSVPITTLPQAAAMWCVPAAASAVINGTADQSYLARLMRTDEHGTHFRRVPRALEPFTDYRYVFSHGSASYRDAAGLMAKVRYQVGVLHRALILGVEGDLLPYWPPGVWGTHAVVVSGWRGAYILVWDPLSESWNRRTGGFHLLLPEDLARAGLGNSRAMIR